MIRCMIAFRDQDVPCAMVAPIRHEGTIKKDRCLTISKTKKGANTLTVTTQSTVSIFMNIYIPICRSFVGIMSSA